MALQVSTGFFLVRVLLRSENRRFPPGCRFDMTGLYASTYRNPWRYMNKQSLHRRIRLEDGE